MKDFQIAKFFKQPFQIRAESARVKNPVESLSERTLRGNHEIYFQLNSELDSL